MSKSLIKAGIETNLETIEERQAIAYVNALAAISASPVKVKSVKPKQAKVPKFKWEPRPTALGTFNSFNRNVCKLDARPKAALGDRRLMSEAANVSSEDMLYQVPKSMNWPELFIEFLRVRKVKADREAATALSGKLSAAQYHQMKRAIRCGNMTKVARILESALVLNQVQG